MDTEIREMTFKIMIDGKEGLVTLGVTKKQFETLNETLVLTNRSYDGLALEALKYDKATQQNTAGLMKFIQTENLNEQTIRETIKALQEETANYATASEGYIRHQASITNLTNAYAGLTKGGINPVVRGSSSARMAVSQFGFAMGDAGMIAVDFRMFLMGIGNNIPFIVQGLAQVSTEAKEAGMSMGKFLKSNIDAPMKMVLGANALMLAMQVLPPIFNKINEASNKAAKEGLSKFNREFKKMSSIEVRFNKKNIEEQLSALKAMQESLIQNLPGGKYLGLANLTGFNATGLGAQIKMLETMLKSLKEKNEENIERSGSKIDKLKLDIENIDKDILKVKDNEADADNKILKLRNKQAAKQKELNELLMTSEERLKKQKELSDKEKQKQDEQIAKINEKYNLIKRLNELEDKSNINNIIFTEKLIMEELKHNLSLENKIKLLEKQKELQEELNAGLDFFAESQEDIDKVRKEFDEQLRIDEKNKFEFLTNSIEAQKQYKEFISRQEIENIKDEYEKERGLVLYDVTEKLKIYEKELKEKLITLGQYNYAKILLEQQAALKIQQINEQEANEKKSIAGAAIDGIAAGFDTMWNQMIIGSRKAKDEWDAIWLSMRNTALSRLGEIVTDELISQLGKLGAELFGKGEKAESKNSGGGSTIMDILSIIGTVIPFLADGAIVTKPTLAVVGEGKEPEGVFPLSNLNRMLEAENSSTNTDRLEKLFGHYLQAVEKWNSNLRFIMSGFDMVSMQERVNDIIDKYTIK